MHPHPDDPDVFGSTRGASEVTALVLTAILAALLGAALVVAVNVV